MVFFCLLRMTQLAANEHKGIGDVHFLRRQAVGLLEPLVGLLAGILGQLDFGLKKTTGGMVLVFVQQLTQGDPRLPAHSQRILAIRDSKQHPRVLGHVDPASFKMRKSPSHIAVVGEDHGQSKIGFYVIRL